MIDEYVVVDLEMTGLNPKTDKVIEIGAVKVKAGKVVDTYSMLVNPEKEIPFQVTDLTGISNEMVADGEETDKAMKGLLDFMGQSVLVGHNVSFDYSFIKQWAVNKKIPIEVCSLDTLKIARKLLPPEQPKKLEALCEYFNINRENAHRALDDALETAEIFERLKAMAKEACENSKTLSKTNYEDMFKAKQLVVKIKRQTPATKHQLERLKEYMEAHGITDPIEFDKLTRSEASRLRDQYVSKYGK